MLVKIVLTIMAEISMKAITAFKISTPKVICFGYTNLSIACCHDPPPSKYPPGAV